MEHSAEWLRGAVFMAECLGCPQTEEQYGILLAAAEAREARENGDWFDWPPPESVSEVIAWREDSGVFPAQVCVIYEGDRARDWFTHGGRESLYGYMPTKWKPYPAAPGKATHPTAAEVIAKCKTALEEVEFECDGKVDVEDGSDGFANRPNLAMRCDMAVVPDLIAALEAAEAERDERTTMAARAQEAMRYLLNGLPATDAIWAAYGNADSARAWLAARDARMKAEGAAEALEKEAGEIGRALIKGMADAVDYKPNGLVVRVAENCCEYLRAKAAELRRKGGA